MKLIEILKELNKPFYTINDIEKLLRKHNKKSLYVILTRLTESGKLIRLKNGLYTLPENIKDIEIIANQIYFPSYPEGIA